MKSFRDLPIRRKLVLLLMLVSGGALLLANSVLVIFDLAHFRNEMKTDLQTVAEILAQNSTAAVTFDNEMDAEETLSALRAKPSIISACIYSSDGKVFARYFRHGVRDRFPDRPGARDARFVEGSLIVFQPILLNGEPSGTVYLRSDLEELYERLQLQAVTVTLVLLVAALFAFLLSSGLQRVISRPIQGLAETARSISGREDYSLRAEKQSGDELGELVDAFNGMLAQIQQRDSDLLLAKEQLEQRVVDRTIELREQLAERMRAEKELEERNLELHQSNKELDDFAYIASHDLKEPLRGIHNYSVFLIEDYSDKIDDEGRAKLETLMRLTKRMEELIDSLLHFSRVGRVDLALDRVDLNEIVSRVLESIAFNLQEREVEIRMPRPLPTVWCDRARVGEVFSNLIVNAMKYNDKPEKWVEIGIAEGVSIPENQESGEIAVIPEDTPVLYVRDNGIGIQEKHFDSIFRIFKRLHARDKFGGGTGAGLTIVKKIVERHSGRIWVDSAYGTGTTIYFTLGKEA